MLHIVRHLCFLCLLRGWLDESISTPPVCESVLMFNSAIFEPHHVLLLVNSVTRAHIGPVRSRTHHGNLHAAWRPLYPEVGRNLPQSRLPSARPARARALGAMSCSPSPPGAASTGASQISNPATPARPQNPTHKSARCNLPSSSPCLLTRPPRPSLPWSSRAW